MLAENLSLDKLDTNKNEALNAFWLVLGDFPSIIADVVSHVDPSSQSDV